MNLTRKDFIKKAGLLSFGILSFTKLGKMKDVEAAVLDNTKNNDISSSVIYTDSVTDEYTIFSSGQSASKLVTVVNSLNAKIQSKIDELSQSFKEALDNLKNTNLAKAINLTADTFPEANELLSQIKVYTKEETNYSQDGNIVISNVNPVDIPEGFYSAGLGLSQSDNPQISIDRASLLSVDNLRDAGIKTITDNGSYSTLKDNESVYESFEVCIDKDSEGIGNSIYNEGYDQATLDIFNAAVPVTITALEESVSITPDEGTLFNSVTVKPQVHSDKRATQTITSNGSTTIDLGENHNIKEVPLTINVQPSVSLNQGCCCYGGTLTFYVSKACKAILFISRATRYALSSISITGCYTSISQIGPSQPAVIGNEVRMHTDTYLLNLNAGYLYVTFTCAGGQEVNAAVLTTL